MPQLNFLLSLPLLDDNPRRTVIMSIGWYRLLNARRSQLFLRSALKRRKDEELSRRWGVMPPGLASRRQGRDQGRDKEERKSDKGTAEEVMMKKDGSQL
jgi:hypothetical protein